MHTPKLKAIATAAATAALACAVAKAAPPAVTLARSGTPLMPVVVGSNASPRVRSASTNLAAYLRAITGAPFPVQTNGGPAGILVGLPADFPALTDAPSFSGGPFGREDYVLRSTRDAIWVLGASDLGVEHAAWDLLYRLGYRQFFPGPTWEVVPRIDAPSLSVDIRESPAFYARRIWYNWGLWGYNNEPYRQWCARNRHAQGFRLNSGHAYGGIIAANKAAFDAHPEYLSLVNGARLRGGDAKFCISNPELRRLVVEHAVRQFRNQPDMDSISMDPSDGDNWCECESCARMGSPSDRALALANAVAEAINGLGLGPKFVGMYAYNRHSPPPASAVHSNVIISATTAFLRGGYTLDQIIDGWKARGATLGIYDYFSVVDWDWNLPGRARSANPASVSASVARFHARGARFYDCESGDAWGPYGLGYYVAARTMWDTNEAAHVKELTDDFLDRAFGPSREPMARFYRLITEDTARRPGRDLVGRMYRHLADARAAAAGRADVQKRIEDLILYTRYVELYNDYSNAGGDTREAARDRMVSYAFRIRKTMMVHAYGIWARTVGQKAAHEASHPLKDEAPFSDSEIAGLLTNGMAANEPVEMGFTPVAFSQDLVPATPLALPVVEPGRHPVVPQDRQFYYVWVPKAPAHIALKVTVQKVWNTRPHLISLHSPLEVSLNAVDESDIVRPDGRTYDVVLDTPYEGLHWIETRDGGDYTRIEWPAGVPVTIPSAIDTPTASTHFRGEWTLYFYVPRGTRTVGGWAARVAQWAPRLSGTLCDGQGRVQIDFATREDGWFSAAVPDGQDGRLWKFERSQGMRQLMTVPPFLARDARELLLPRQVVERDRPKP